MTSGTVQAVAVLSGLMLRVTESDDSLRLPHATCTCCALLALMCLLLLDAICLLPGGMYRGKPLKPVLLW